MSWWPVTAARPCRQTDAGSTRERLLQADPGAVRSVDELPDAVRKQGPTPDGEMKPWSAGATTSRAGSGTPIPAQLVTAPSEAFATIFTYFAKTPLV